MTSLGARREVVSRQTSPTPERTAPLKIRVAVFIHRLTPSFRNPRADRRSGLKLQDHIRASRDVLQPHITARMPLNVARDCQRNEWDSNRNAAAKPIPAAYLRLSSVHYPSKTPPTPGSAAFPLIRRECVACKTSPSSTFKHPNSAGEASTIAACPLLPTLLPRQIPRQTLDQLLKIDEGDLQLRDIVDANYHVSNIRPCRRVNPSHHPSFPGLVCELRSPSSSLSHDVGASGTGDSELANTGVGLHTRCRAPALSLGYAFGSGISGILERMKESHVECGSPFFLAISHSSGTRFSVRDHQDEESFTMYARSTGNNHRQSGSDVRPRKIQVRAFHKAAR
ncbi:hypothetical protein B0H11DRAFT_1905248 [Mycena galericulata]|nr:hypothetical protein B0H11DRAFT_1905248 [Mycena galericulata]